MTSHGVRSSSEVLEGEIVGKRPFWRPKLSLNSFKCVYATTMSTAKVKHVRQWVWIIGRMYSVLWEKQDQNHFVHHKSYTQCSWIKKILRCVLNKAVLKVWIGFISLYVGYRVVLFWKKTNILQEFSCHRINLLNVWKIIFLFAPYINVNQTLYYPTNAQYIICRYN